MKHFALTEAEYGEAWKASLEQERAGKPVEVFGGLLGRVARIMQDGRERTTQDICRSLGYPELASNHSDYKCVTNALTTLRRRERLTSINLGEGIRRVAVWRAAPHEPRVSCKDRIAAAKAEATK